MIHSISSWTNDVAEEDGLGIEEQVYRRLRNALMEGGFTPGDRLSIRKAAGALQTSPMPVRTALRRLTTEKALDLSPTGASIVPRLTRKEFVELTAIRQTMEPLAVRMAASHLDNKVFKQLDRIIAQHREAADRGDPDAYLRADRDFLFVVYRASDAPMLLGFIEAMWMRRSPLFWEAKWALLGHGGKARDRHDELLLALKESRIEDATVALRQEIQDAADFLLEQVQFAGEIPAESGVRSLSPVRAPRHRRSS